MRRVCHGFDAVAGGIRIRSSKEANKEVCREKVGSNLSFFSL